MFTSVSNRMARWSFQTPAAALARTRSSRSRTTQFLWLIGHKPNVRLPNRQNRQSNSKPDDWPAKLPRRRSARRKVCRPSKNPLLQLLKKRRQFRKVWSPVWPCWTRWRLTRPAAIRWRPTAEVPRRKRPRPRSTRTTPVARPTFSHLTFNRAHPSRKIRHSPSQPRSRPR